MEGGSTHIPIYAGHLVSFPCGLAGYLLLYSVIYLFIYLLYPRWLGGSSLTSRKDGMAFQQVRSSHEPENNDQPNEKKIPKFIPMISNRSVRLVWIDRKYEREFDGA
jgi:hypothetical protein